MLGSAKIADFDKKKGKQTSKALFKSYHHIDLFEPKSSIIRYYKNR